MKRSGSIWRKALKTVTVFAVPESPQNITGLLIMTKQLSSHEYLVVSTVGTRID
jgi:hypothetical protein